MLLATPGEVIHRFTVVALSGSPVTGPDMPNVGPIINLDTFSDDVSIARCTLGSRENECKETKRKEEEEEDEEEEEEEEEEHVLSVFMTTINVPPTISTSLQSYEYPVETECIGVFFYAEKPPRTELVYSPLECVECHRA